MLASLIAADLRAFGFPALVSPTLGCILIDHTTITIFLDDNLDQITVTRSLNEQLLKTWVGPSGDENGFICAVQEAITKESVLSIRRQLTSSGRTIIFPARCINDLKCKGYDSTFHTDRHGDKHLLNRFGQCIICRDRALVESGIHAGIVIIGDFANPGSEESRRVSKTIQRIQDDVSKKGESELLLAITKHLVDPTPEWR